MRIRYIAPALASDGYGEFSRYIISALHERGHDVSVVLLPDSRIEPGSWLGEKGVLCERLVGRSLDGPPDVNIVNGLSRSFAALRLPRAGRSPENAATLNIGFTMCEAEQISSITVYECNAMDAVFVPSRWNKRVFEEHGVKVPVFVVNPAISLAPTALERVAPLVFYSVFEWITPHKDPKALLTAYFQEFQAGEPVLLRIKTFERCGNDIASEIRSLKHFLRQARYPKVELVLGPLSNTEMWASYQAADVYVSSHHGEGWGMPIWEAMATGLPAIATAYSASAEFMNHENSYPVAFTFDTKRRWANVSVPALQTAMRHALDHQDEARATGARARRSILERFTQEATEKAIVQAVQALRAGAEQSETARDHRAVSGGAPASVT